MARVVIVQPYIPRYRVELFCAMVRQLAAQGIELLIAHGDPPADLASRGDAANPPWALRVPSTTAHLLGRSLIHYNTGQIPNADLIILEQAMHNLSLTRLLLPRRLRRQRIALWGHGRTFTSSSNQLSQDLKRRLTQRADWFFAYTQGGAEHLVTNGYPRDQVTVLNNTIDVDPILHWRAHLEEAEICAWKLDNSITNERILLFIGGLDECKRPAFLMASLERLTETRSDLVLVVAGEGSARARFENVNLPIRRIGRADARTKAILARSAELILMPGRVGLVAIDSFAMGLPIVTTDWPWHAPEFAYLKSTENSLITKDDLQDYAEGVGDLLDDDVQREYLVRGCDQSRTRYSLDGMVREFVSGVELALRAGG